MMDTDRVRARLLLWRHFPRVIRLAARQRRRALGGIAAWALSALLGLGYLHAIRLFGDVVLNKGDTGLLPPLVFLVAALFVLRAGCGAVRTVLLARARAETTAVLRLDLHRSVLGAPLPEIEERKSAALGDRVLRDLEAVMGLLFNAGPMFVHSLVLFFGAAIYCFSLHWKLSLLGMAAVPPFLVLSFLQVRRLRPRYKELSEQHSRLGATLQQHYAGARVLKAFARESWAVGQAGEQQGDLVEKTMDLTRRRALLAALAALVTGAGLVAVLWYGVRLVHGPEGGSFGPGALMALCAGLGVLSSSVVSLVGLANTIQQSLASAERVFELGDLSPEAGFAQAGEKGMGEIPPVPPGDLRIRGLCFAYPASKGHREGETAGDESPRDQNRVLRGLDLDLPSGEVVALVGPSGVGKTTTTALLARLLEPDAGTVRWGGTDVASIPLEAWRCSLALVQQEDWLLAATVRENLAMGRRNMGEDDLWEALSLARAKELVQALPEGLDTELGERGHRLSGGERQRLCLARAILGKPRLLLLDEATAALDLKTEAEIFSRLRRMPGNPSVLVVSHRLSAVSAADKIYFLESGRIVEEGSHEELMARGGRYARTFLLHAAPEPTAFGGVRTSPGGGA